MSRELLTEEEKRQRRNEASRRCYLKRKAAAQNGQLEPMGVKNRSVGRPPKAPSVVRDTEKLVKKFTKTASNIKPMLKNAAEILIDAYKNYDDKTIQKIERMMIRDLGLVIVSPCVEDLSKSKVGITMWSKSIKTPAFRLTTIDNSNSDDSDSDDNVETESNDNDDTDITDDDFENPNEIPVDPSQLDNIDAETDMTSLDIDDFNNDDIEDEDDEFDDEDDEEDEFDENEDEDDDDEDDDEDDDISENRRRRRNDFDTARDYEAGRWDMFNEMGAQGAFDD
jgi:hypothetical protein